MKKIALLIGVMTWCCFSETVLARVLYSFDFAGIKASDAQEWLEDNNFKFRLDADDLRYGFGENGLTIYNEGDLNGLLVKKVDIKNVKRVRIEWGVKRYSQGIDWEAGMTRDAIMIIFSFGKKKISSGSFIIPDLPYFIGLFLGEKEIENKAYTGTYYQKGGRYICTPCNNPPTKTVITELDIHERFLDLFDEKEVPPISAISIETDTRDLEQPSEAFIKKIELLSD